MAEGCLLGSALGAFEGCLLGSLDGADDGCDVGQILTEGNSDGCKVNSRSEKVETMVKFLQG